MKKTFGYKSLDGNIYENKYDCIKADDLYRARQIRGSVGEMRTKIYDLVRYSDQVLGYKLARESGGTEEQRAERRKIYDALVTINNEKITELLADLVITSMDELKLIEKELKRNQKKEKSLRKNRTHIINYLKRALWQ
jgi:hypothetical protein